MRDKQWVELEPLLPKSSGRGRRWTEHRTVINGIVWVFNAGAILRSLLEHLGLSLNIYRRFNR